MWTSSSQAGKQPSWPIPNQDVSNVAACLPSPRHLDSESQINVWLCKSQGSSVPNRNYNITSTSVVADHKALLPATMASGPSIYILLLFPWECLLATFSKSFPHAITARDFAFTVFLIGMKYLGC